MLRARGAPLRFARLRSVLEVGMGYTSPFLARALADNWADIERERKMLVAKTPDLAARRGPGTERSEIASFEAWVHAPLKFAIPSFYAEAKPPAYLAIERLTTPGTTADRVKGVPSTSCGSTSAMGPTMRISSTASGRWSGHRAAFCSCTTC